MIAEKEITQIKDNLPQINYGTQINEFDDLWLLTDKHKKCPKCGGKLEFVVNDFAQKITTPPMEEKFDKNRHITTYSTNLDLEDGTKIFINQPYKEKRINNPLVYLGCRVVISCGSCRKRIV